MEASETRPRDGGRSARARGRGESARVFPARATRASPRVAPPRVAPPSPAPAPASQSPLVVRLRGDGTRRAAGSRRRRRGDAAAGRRAVRMRDGEGGWSGARIGTHAGCACESRLVACDSVWVAMGGSGARAPSGRDTDYTEGRGMRAKAQRPERTGWMNTVRRRNTHFFLREGRDRAFARAYAGARGARRGVEYAR